MSLDLDDGEGRRILAAADRLVARRGHDFSMADLTRGAGISRATLIRRIGRREAILDAHRRGSQAPASTRERILRAAVELIGELTRAAPLVARRRARAPAPAFVPRRCSCYSGEG